jgi:cysteine sulfinate desulfinase/cysteine desulfurase-like protein/glyoxylase-like metal-dependent hydrolase (beta-lactamase superfamily II)
MELYLDANATTPVLPQARAAALAAMAETFGNPSSVHGAGLKARALVDGVRERARRLLGAPAGRLTFTSGATEGIQTAVLSALRALHARRAAGEAIPGLLLFGATEHKAVPVALRHWNEVLGLGLEVRAIPVGADGRHDLAWLRGHAARAGLVCTMAANNETGVVSDLAGIERALAGTGALWLVDCVQALGKLPLALGRHPIDYAPFSGHKLYAPKGVGLLYVREGAPFTPLLTGGGQEGDLRAGTENTAGIAALGAVLQALEEHDGFADAATLARWRRTLVDALVEAFPGLVFNAPAELCLPTTINFSVPGVSAKVLLDLFDAAGLRVSGGSACSASKARPSDVLQAMGLPAWRAAGAVRMSFGPADAGRTMEEAARRIRACGAALRASCLSALPGEDAAAPRLVTRFVSDGACCYLVCPPGGRRCVVVDPLPELTEALARLLRCQRLALAAVLDTHSHGDHASSAHALWQAAGQSSPFAAVDALGWPEGLDELPLGDCRMTRLATPGHTADATALVLRRGDEALFAFVGDTVLPGALGRSDFAQSDPSAFARSLRLLDARLGRRVLLLPAHDYDDRHATHLAAEHAAQPLLAAALDGTLADEAFAQAKAALERELAPTAWQTLACGARVDGGAAGASVELEAAALRRLIDAQPRPLLVDVRELYEQRVGEPPAFARGLPPQSVPLSALADALPGWLRLPADRPLVFYCRSGNRSAQAARTLRRLGHPNAWSLAGGLALQDAGARQRLEREVR